MASLDIYVLFTKVPLDDNNDFSIKKLFENPKTLVKGVSKTDFPDLPEWQPNNHLLHLTASFISR